MRWPDWICLAGTPCAIAPGTADAPAQPRTETAGECGLTAREVYERFADTVVQIVSFGADPHRVAGRVRSGAGSGILIGETLVVTNQHVVHVVHGSELILVNDGRWSVAAVVFGSDPTLDVAVLSLAESVPAPGCGAGSFRSSGTTARWFSAATSF